MSQRFVQQKSMCSVFDFILQWYWYNWGHRTSQSCCHQYVGTCCHGDVPDKQVSVLYNYSQLIFDGKILV